MNILMVTSSYPKFRGDVTAPFIESIATHIAAQGHNVHVLLPAHRDWSRAAVEDGVHFHTFRYSPSSRWTPWGYAESLRADVKIKRGMYLLAPVVFLAALRALDHMTAREPFDVLHAHWVLPNAPMASVISRRRQLPLVVSLHGSDVFVAEKWRPLGALARWCFGQAIAITAPSDDLMARGIALGASEARMELIPYGADLKAFHVIPEAAQRVRTRLQLEPGTLLILAVGRMVYKKGFDFLVDAMSEVLPQAPHARLVLAGDGDLRSELEARAAALGLDSHIIFVGRVPRQDIPAHFAAADIVVVPSVRDEAGNVDGLPNVALEAMAAGKPLIASRVGGLPQVVRDGVNGLLVDEKSPRQLAEAILTLARDIDLRRQLGASGRVHVREALNWDHVARQFIAVYERVK